MKIGVGLLDKLEDGTKSSMSSNRSDGGRSWLRVAFGIDDIRRIVETMTGGTPVGLYPRQPPTVPPGFGPPPKTFVDDDWVVSEELTGTTRSLDEFSGSTTRTDEVGSR